MKAVLLYWIVGSCLYGLVLAGHLVKCPNDDLMANASDLIMVAIWPAGLTGAMSLPSDFKHPPTKCKATP